MNKSILVVEYDGALLQLIHEVLTQAHYTVRVAQHRSAALAALQQQEPCLMLLADGHGSSAAKVFLTEMRYRRIGENIPIVITAWEPAEELAVTAVELDAAGYLPKPFGRQELLRVVKRWCGTPHPDADERA